MHKSSADSGGGLRRLQPPSFWSKNFTKIRSIFAIFRAATPFRSEWWTKVVMRGCTTPPPFSKISRTLWILVSLLDRQVQNNTPLVECWCVCGRGGGLKGGGNEKVSYMKVPTRIARSLAFQPSKRNSRAIRAKYGVCRYWQHSEECTCRLRNSYA